MKNMGEILLFLILVNPLINSAITGIDGVDDVPDIDLPYFEWDVKVYLPFLNIGWTFFKIDLLSPIEGLFNWFFEVNFDLLKMPFYAIKGLFLFFNSLLEGAGIGAPAIYIAVILTITIVLALMVVIIKIILPFW